MDFDHVSVDPAIVNGQPCIRGTRLTVRAWSNSWRFILDRAQLLREFPELDEGSVRQALRYAAANLVRTPPHDDAGCRTASRRNRLAVQVVSRYHEYGLLRTAAACREEAAEGEEDGRAGAGMIMVKDSVSMGTLVSSR